MDLYSRYDSGTKAIVLAEGEFGEPGGKTANGVVLHGEIFDPLVVIDSTKAPTDAATVLARSELRDIPVVGSMTRALEVAPEAETLVIGVAPAGGALPDAWIDDIKQAMEAGCDVVSGLHVFLSERDEWIDFADECGVDLLDVRKAPEEDALRVVDGSNQAVEADVVLTLGTDCAVGKRTTTYELYKAATSAGLDATWVATGQTGIMIGAEKGVVVDRVPADFAAGVVEEMVTDLDAGADVIFVEGQGALTHPAYGGVTLSILHGAAPDAAVLVDAPDRDRRTHFEQFPVEGVETERRAIEAVSETTVAGLSTWGDPESEGNAHGLTAGNVYHEGGPASLLEAVRAAL